MTTLITETVAAAERAVAGEDSLIRDYCDRLLGDLEELRSGRDEEHVYLAALLDSIGLRKESALILRAAAASRSAASRAVLQNAEGMLAAKHGQLERARVLLEQALLAATDSPAVRSKILANLAAVSLMAGSIEDARTWVDQLDASAETNDPAVSVLTKSVRAALAVAARDRPGLGTAVTALHEASMARTAELGQHPRAVAIVANMAVAEATAAQASGSRVRLVRAINVLEVTALRLGAEIGADDPETLTVQACLARAKFSLALADGSIPAMETALASLARVRQRATVRGDDHHVAQLERDLALTRQALLQFQANFSSPPRRFADETHQRLGRFPGALWWIGSVGSEFLAWLSGTQRRILDRCPTERPKYAGFGAIILITAIMATVSMVFALVSALNVKLWAALPSALFWGFFVMCIDRWLLVTLRPQKRISANFFVVAPRVGLSLLFAAIISTPLILQIFQPEINREIPVVQARAADVYYQEQSNSSLSRQIAEQQKEVKRLQQEAAGDGSGSDSASKQKLTKQLDQATHDANEAYAQWQCELTGRGAGGQTCVQGDGPLAQASENRYRADQAQIEKYQAEIAALTATQQATQQRSTERELQSATQSLQAAQGAQLRQSTAFSEANQGNKGLLIRLQALDAATVGNSTLSTARWLLFALFAIIECLPVLVKFISNLGSPGIYEGLLQLEEEEIMKIAVRESKNRLTRAEDTLTARQRDLIARGRPAHRTFAGLGGGQTVEREAVPRPEDSDVP